MPPPDWHALPTEQTTERDNIWVDQYIILLHVWILPFISLLSLFNILMTMQFLVLKFPGFVSLSCSGPLIVRYEYAFLTRMLLLLMHIQWQRNATPARALRAYHTLPPCGLKPVLWTYFVAFFPRSPPLHTAKQSLWLTRSVISPCVVPPYTTAAPFMQ